MINPMVGPIYQFKITLLGVEPPIWLRVQTTGVVGAPLVGARTVPGLSGQQAGLSELQPMSRGGQFGKGFDASNLRYMHLFYQAFPNCDALRHELGCKRSEDARAPCEGTLSNVPPFGTQCVPN